MNLIKADIDQIDSIVEMSVRAFGTDTAVGGKEGDAPPDHNSPAWHRKMAEEGHLYVAVEDETIVGAAILFENEKEQSLTIGRIFIDSIYHRKGYGTLLMQKIESMFPYIREFHLDTPECNIRTNAFYTKIGYRKIKVEDGFIFYQKKKTMIETERLFLREMNAEDFDALYKVLADSDIMQHYPYTFDEKRVRGWIERNIERYCIFGFGLWAVCLKDTGEMIGDCGLTLQNINGEMLPEIGYHIRRDCQRKGYASEAAKAVRDWAFRNTDYPSLYSYCKYTNLPSIKTAESIGMHFICEYPDETNGTTHVSAISREEWLNVITERSKEQE